MAYRVISPFADLQDKSKEFPDGRLYAIGDTFPYGKKSISEDRIKQLMSVRNAIGQAVIEEVKQKKTKED